MFEKTSENQPDFIDKKRQTPQLLLSQAARDLGVEITFNGFYSTDTNSRARATGNKIEWNEKFLDAPIDEIERIAYHEVQHVQTFHLTEDNDDIGVVVLDPDYSNLYARMKGHYTKHVSQGYPFKHEFSDQPTSMTEAYSRRKDYAGYDELLSLLRGYERFLQQQSAGTQTKTQPYEFIDAFKLEDLKYLDEEQRSKIKTALLKNNPKILEVNTPPTAILTFGKKN